MRVFSWKGEIDTIMTPMDSIRYHKSFLAGGNDVHDPTDRRSKSLGRGNRL